MPEAAHRCVDAGVHSTVLTNPTPDQIAAALAALNAEALAEAQSASDAALVHITNEPTAGTISTPYSFQLAAAGGTGPYTFTLVDGALPGGMTLSSSGLLSGTPVLDYAFLNSGTNTFIWRVKIRAVGNTDDACYRAFALVFANTA